MRSRDPHLRRRPPSLAGGRFVVRLGQNGAHDPGAERRGLLSRRALHRDTNAPRTTTDQPLLRMAATASAYLAAEQVSDRFGDVFVFGAVALASLW